MIVPLAFYLFIFWLKEFLLDRLIKKGDREINNLKTRKGKRVGGLSENEKWGGLEIGDIVLMKQDEVSPADIIVLDSSEIKNKEAFCYIEDSGLTGKFSLTKKKAVYLTQLMRKSKSKGKFEEYRKILTGKIEYECPNKDINSFNGLLKLKKDPKSERLDIQNLIPRGTILRQTEWIFGMVVYTCDDTKIMLHSQHMKIKHSKIEKMLQMVFGVTFLLYIFCSFASIMSLITKNKLRPAYLKLFLFVPMIPFGLPTVLDIYYIVRKIQVELKYRKKKSSVKSIENPNNDQLLIRNPAAFANLGHIEYVLLDKTGTLTKDNYYFESIFHQGKIYSFKLNELEEKIKKNEKQINENGEDLVNLKTLEEVNLANSAIFNPEEEKFNELESIASEKHNVVEESLVLHAKYSQRNNSPKSNNNNTLSLIIDPEQNSLIEKKETFFFDLKPPVLTEKLNSSNDFSNTLFSAKNDKNLDAYIQRPSENKSTFLASELKSNRLELNFPAKINSTNLNYLESIHEMSFTAEEFLQDNIYPNSGFNLFEILALCHLSKGSVETSKNNYKYSSYRKEEIPVLELAKMSNYTFLKPNKVNNPSEYSVKFKNYSYTYEIFGINDFTQKRKRFSLVVKSPPKGNQIYLLCKGPDFSMRNRLNLDIVEKENLDEILKLFYLSGQKPIIYAKKKLRYEDAIIFKEKLANLKTSLIPQEENLEEIADILETEMELVSVVGLKYELNDHAEEFIEYIKEIDAKIWMVTGDSKESALSVANNLNIFSSKTDPCYIIEENPTNISSEIRNILVEINDYTNSQINKKEEKENDSDQLRASRVNYKSMTNRYTMLHVNEFKSKYVILNGKSLEIIIQDNYLHFHLMFILWTFKIVIAYDLTPQNKAFLASLIQKCFTNSPGVMAIGDGFNDVPMFHHADVSIEFLKNSEMKLNAGDLVLSNFKLVKALMQYEGKVSSDHFEILVGFHYYAAIMIGATFFFFSWYTTNSGTSLFNSLFLLGFTYFLPGFLCIGLIFGTTQINNKILKQYPSLYLEGVNRMHKSLEQFVFRVCLEPIVFTAMAFYITSYIVSRYVDSASGYQTDYINIQILVAIEYVLLLMTKSILVARPLKGKLIIFGIIIIYTALIIIMITFTLLDTKFFSITILNYFPYSINNFSFVMGVIYNVLTPILLYFLFRYYFYYKISMKVIDKFSEIISGDPIPEDMVNKLIISSNNINNDLSLFVKKNIRKFGAILDPAIQELLNPADINLNEVQINRLTLEIIDLSLENRYNVKAIKKSLKSIRLIFVILMLITAIYGIHETILSSFKAKGILTIAFFVSFLFMFGLTFGEGINKYFYRFLTIGWAIGIMIKIIFEWWESNDDSFPLLTAVFSCFSTVCFNLKFNYIFLINAVGGILIFILRNTVLYYDSGYFNIKKSKLKKQMSSINDEEIDLIVFYLLLVYTVFVSAITCLNLYINYRNEKKRRSDFIAKIKIDFEANTVQDILSILVPKFVKDQMNLGRKTMEEAQDNVVILFCDICDFDQMIAVEGKKIVQILDELFRHFDQLCITHGIQKIETVGKTYMAAAGIKACELLMSKEVLNMEKTLRVLKMAFDMMSHTSKLTYGNGIHFQIKIGVHLGKVIAGVIGYHKPQFSLIGDTVNTTSRICSTGLTGIITISEQAYENVKSADFKYEKKIVSAKGKGDLITYQCFPNKNNKKNKPKKGLLKKKLLNNMGNLRKELAKLKNTKKTKEKKVDNGLIDQKGVQYILNITIQKKIEKEKDEDDNDLAKRHKSMNALNKRISMQFLNKDGAEDLDEEDVEEFDELEKYMASQDKDILKPKNKYLLTFSKNQDSLVAEYMYDLVRQYSRESKRNLFILAISCVFNVFILISIRNFFNNYMLVLFTKATFSIGCFLVAILLKSLESKRYAKYVFMGLFLYGVAQIMVQSNCAKFKEFHNTELLEFLLVYLIFTHFVYFNFLEILIATFIITVSWMIFGFVKKMSSIELSLFYLSFVFVTLFKVYNQIKSNIKSFNNLNRIELKKTEQNNLVSQLLPYHAFEKLKYTSLTNKLGLTDEIQNVTLLFADIAGFTKYSSSVNPEDVVTMLRNLFTEFDKMCFKYKLYKVYTIGDCYVIMGFVNANKREPIEEAKNMVKMGLAMIRIIRAVREIIQFYGLDMRIGIHTGNIIGGIIGTDIVRYDIYGNNVLIANKMESNGVEGNIMVSQSTKDLLEKDKNLEYTFLWHKNVELKNGDPVPAYLLSCLKEDEED